jgi:folate-dependent tRNA-U54 methylase TrmFO/GidA
MKPQARQKIVVVGAGPVGSLAALYAASRGDELEIYELRGGKRSILNSVFCLKNTSRCSCSVCYVELNGDFHTIFLSRTSTNLHY